MEPIRALPVMSRAGRILVERREQGLIGSIVAAVYTALDLKDGPNVSIYLWDELGKGPGKLSEKLSHTLTDVFKRNERVKVLSQFQRDSDEKIDSDTEVIRKLWHDNAIQYRPIGADGKPEGWSKPARVMMCQAILTGALRHVAKRRLQAAKQDQVEVKLTAVIADDGETLSTAQKVERTQAFILNDVPTTEFLRHKHAQMSLDANARSVIRNATCSRPTDPVIVGYAGKMPTAAKAIFESLDPEEGSSDHSIADFGRLSLAALNAPAAGLASSAMGMQDYSRFNLSSLTSKITSAAKCRDKQSKADMNVTTSDLNLHMAALVHHLFKTMSARPDLYQAEIGMFASDNEKASMYSSARFFLAAVGRAEQQATGSAPKLRTAFENTRTNHTAASGLRLSGRWEWAVDTAAVVETTPSIAQSASTAQSIMGAGSDSDEDMRVGMKYLQQTLPAVTAPTKRPGKDSWDPPEGTMDDVIAALAVTGVPCAIVSFSPSEEDPLTQVVEWDDGVFPAPMEDNGEQLTSTISRTYAPAGPHDPDEGQRGHNPTEWINRYLDTHPRWTVILSRRGLDGRLSFATFVRRKSAPLPMSVADEARRLQVEDSQDSLQLAIISFGRSKLISVAAHSLNETRPKGICPSEPCSEERLTQAKADMLLTARTFPGKLEWNIETLVSLAVADSLEQCLEALDGEQASLGGAMDAHVELRKTPGLPADDTGTYMAHAFISTQRTNATQNDR